MINKDTLEFYQQDTNTIIKITEGEFEGIEFYFGRCWFPDENQPVLSFDYDIVSEKKPDNKELFEQEIGKILHALLVKAVEEQTTIYTGGTDETVVEESRIILPETTIFTGP